MGAATDRQPKSKRKRRKLFVQDRSFFGDESLTYPEANPTTIDGDILKLKVPSKSQSKRSRKHNHVNSRHSKKVTAVHHDKFDKKEAKMDRLKRKREDSQDSKAPASKKHKSGSLDADADAHVNTCGQLDECSPIIDVVHISSNPSESSNIPGHHEEWHFSSLDNSVVEVNSCAPRSNSTEHQSAKKKDLINRFLSDAVSALGMSEKCLASSGDELSSDDITEAADLISSHHRNQSRNVKGTSCRTSRVRNNISELSELSDLSDLSEPSDLKRAKCSKTRNEFSDKSPLSSGQMWLLRQILPSDNYLSTANPEERCSSPVNSLHSDSAESVQILEHIKPPTATTTKKKSKKNKRVKERKVKKTKEKKKKRKKKKTERDQEKLCKETNKLRKNTDELLNITEKEADCKGKHEQIVVGNKEKGKHHNQKEEERKRNEEKKTNLDSDVICASTNMLSYFGSKSEDNKRHEECENKLNKIGSLKVFRKKKEVSVQMQLTNEVILHLPSGRNLEETVSSPKSQLGDSVKKKKTEDRNAPKFDVSTVQELLSEDADNVHFGNSLETHEISVAATESTNESERRKSKKVITNGSKEAKILYSEPICNDTDQPNQTDYFNYTSDETNEHIDVSMLENSQVNHENSLDELHKNFSLVGKKMKETSQRMECCKVACSETLQQLVEKASSSLKNCGNYSTNEYSPDLFDGTVEDTNSLERNQKKNAQPGAAQEEILNKNRVMSELGNCETLQQLVHKASTSLRNCESTSTIDCSPDMFDANAVVTSKAIHIKKKSRKNRTHVSDPGESPLSYTVSSNEQGKLSGEERQQANKTPCLENVSTNSSPEVLESCSPWHRLTQDSNGSFTARSEEISEVSPQETGSHLHKNIFTPHSSDGQGIMNKSHGSQRLNTSCSVGANESSLEETLTSAAALSLQLNNPKVILPKNREPASNSEAIKKRVSKEGSCSNIKLNKKLVKSRSSQNESEPPENSRIPPSLSKNSPNKRSIKKNAGKIVESKVKDVVKRRKMKCTRCRTLFDTELLMALHKCISGIKQRTVEEPHRTDYADYKCEICGKVYVMIQSLREHVKLVHEGVRRYKCDECPMAFGVKQTLIVHKRLHTNTLPFECRICSKLTRTKGNLHRHYSQAHRLTANFPCDICPHKNVWCFFEQDLKEHLEKFHSQSIISTIKTL